MDLLWKSLGSISTSQEMKLNGHLIFNKQKQKGT